MIGEGFDDYIDFLCKIRIVYLMTLYISVCVGVCGV